MEARSAFCEDWAHRPSMSRTPRRYDAEQAQRCSDMTIAYYDRFARAFWNGTRDHDVSQNYAAFLDAIEGEPPYSILKSAPARHDPWARSETAKSPPNVAAALHQSATRSLDHSTRCGHWIPQSNPLSFSYHVSLRVINQTNILIFRNLYIEAIERSLKLSKDRSMIASIATSLAQQPGTPEPPGTPPQPPPDPTAPRRD